ncbi:MAG TPA: 3-keto-5-aminohexanoate cleavage protein [Actinomycetota bacterium]|nr:3-keto-5-aminohexanoate cleavage protein [Actinomycetota bacterium]
MTVEEPCIITCAVSGAVANKQQCPGIPYTPEEYAKEVRRARDAGASMVHIHARTPEGVPTVEPEHYQAITQAVLADTPDIIINYSTGWVGLPMAERVGHITQLKPEIGALNMGSMNYAKYSEKRKGFVFNFVFENNFEDIIFLLERMNETAVKPECECFDVGHVESVEPLIDLGVLTPPIQFSLIHGVLGGIQATARNLAHMASVVPTGSTWGVIAISRDQWTMVGAAAALGGNVRVGFEDNFYLPSGEMAGSNGDLVEAAASIVRLQGRKVAEPAEARALLSLPTDPDRSAVLA